jgi:HEPN domain-containing protein
MPLDPARVEDTKAWLIRASEDLRGAEVDLAALPPLLGDALFHCQQAVEKVLKAFLTWHDLAIRKTPDLAVIGEKCVAVDPTLNSMLRRSATLTEYAWKYRYPGDSSAPTQAEAEEALALAGEVVKAVVSRLPSVTQP